MSFLFPRTIQIKRLPTDSGVGVRPYSGAQAVQETVIASSVPANIQLDRQGHRPDARLPADTSGRGSWRVFFKLPLGTVLERDVIVDDLGNRFQVTNPYWNSLGYACLCERLIA